jgi:hypothetical protein
MRRSPQIVGTTRALITLTARTVCWRVLVQPDLKNAGTLIVAMSALKNFNASMRRRDFGALLCCGVAATKRLLHTASAGRAAEEAKPLTVSVPTVVR